MQVRIASGARVALESAVITHGLPYPQNLESARRMQAAVRASGATPCTVAVLRGIPCVGISDSELEQLAHSPAPSKIALHNLGIARAMQLTGGATVAATMYLAHRAGIEVMATGGIGGVHRDGRDLSGDLPTLARTPILVVCSGAKAILDLPATREWLETYGVPVVGYQTEELPGFYTAHTGLRVDATVHEVDALTELWRAHREMGTAMLVVQPPPTKYALARAEVDALLHQALAECEAAGVSGSATTPWLLQRLAELSEGRTVQVNLALLESNARLAGQIAKRLSLSA
ncbi:MAG: pseudouridine-5-phosphate glycosidase [Armatimonadetes bacterium JP3_11]|nr:MAG: pseudouridine-5-phosphate glycosidase [Armatimonadetes bacterium CP1_7O]OYT75689.1 MAG: pseudouridine-5-phosphate glycosidase [Armatimonadetes bacterium JP3_11]RMH08865.1 MAG: pseudouridine-5'-phosphate glycosidase [Armatimonadota bacterium]